jgi:hypothetical protein
MFALGKYLEFSQLHTRSQPPFLLLYITKMFTYQPSINYIFTNKDNLQHSCLYWMMFGLNLAVRGNVTNC